MELNLETRTGGESTFNYKLFGTVSSMDDTYDTNDTYDTKYVYRINLKSREKLSNKL